MSRAALRGRAILVLAMIGALTAMVVAQTTVKPAFADPPPGRVLSNYENVTGHQLHRDCGYSVALPSDPGESLWLFCDTVITDDADPPNDITPLPFRHGTWAARGEFTVGEVPDALSHLPSPPTTPSLPNNDFPGLFVPNPSDLVDSNNDACLYQASWAGGITAGPDDEVTVRDGTTPVVIADASDLLFVVYGEVCVSAEVIEPWGFDLEPKRTKLAVYDPSDNTFEAVSTLWSVASPTDVLPFYRHVFHPTFHGDYMYMYAVECTNFSAGFGACLDGQTIALRAPLDSLSEGASYQFRTATGWSSNVGDAVDILDTTEAFGSFLVHVGDFSHLGKGYLLMEQLTFGGDYRLWQSATPAGPWSLVDSDQLPCPIGPDSGCYHFWGHPELSTSNDLLYSFYSVYTESNDDGFVEIRSIGTVPDL